jgi:hypothetical protein
MKPAPFKSTFALLDVMAGRAALSKRVRSGPIKVLVEMTIDHPWNGDDGESQEFSCTVLSVKEFIQ